MTSPLRISSKENLLKLLQSVDHIITDCDGVLYSSKGLIAGAAEFLSKLREKGKQVIFVTNNSTVSRIKSTEKLTSLGFEANVNEVFPTSFAVADYLKRHNFDGKVFVVGCQGIHDELSNVSITSIGLGIESFPEVLVPDVDIEPDVNAVVLSYDNLISMPKLIKACTYASKVESKFFIGSECDESVLRQNGQILPLGGSLIAFVETAIKRKAVVLGKPMPDLFRSVIEAHKDLDPRRTLMIGDRLNTDIAFGNNNGLLFTLLVESGENKWEDVVKVISLPGKENNIPSHVAQSLGYLNQFL